MSTEKRKAAQEQVAAEKRSKHNEELCSLHQSLIVRKQEAKEKRKRKGKREKQDEMSARELQ